MTCAGALAHPPHSPLACVSDCLPVPPLSIIFSHRVKSHRCTRRKFNEFLEEAGRGSDDFPKSLDKLSAAGIRLVQADSNDPNGVGFVQWRVAWYVAGEDGDSVLNFLALWDDFMVSKSKAMAKDIECHIHPHKGFDCLEQYKINGMNYEHYTLREPAEESDMPLKWNEAAPCALSPLFVRRARRMRHMCSL